MSPDAQARPVPRDHVTAAPNGERRSRFIFAVNEIPHAQDWRQNQGGMGNPFLAGDEEEEEEDEDEGQPGTNPFSDEYAIEDGSEEEGEGLDNVDPDMANQKLDSPSWARKLCRPFLAMVVAKKERVEKGNAPERRRRRRMGLRERMPERKNGAVRSTDDGSTPDLRVTWADVEMAFEMGELARRPAGERREVFPTELPPRSEGMRKNKGRRNVFGGCFGVGA
ncbi:hypothetical protein K504DRAFT_462966 [Pleomassaria siparia CBS 279.74]|uniref:Uncharacterized protein n=1 Tax=Pleomassaria siparia CBS 279.74 TaxID=1314801 RepID=A0A6G1JU96_9PLEO|nr:hypothetical protein K504DRAFT_462966 [Pleomassaria siparia CBS 279.74]